MELTSDIEELERLTEVSVEQMKQYELKPLNWEVYNDPRTGELWLNIWFEPGPTLDKRRKTAMAILKKVINTESPLPAVVNVEYEYAATDTGIAVWWLC